MKDRIRPQSPALVISLVALFAALGGTVYAAGGRIDGRSIKPKSLPGNRVKPGSMPANRLKAHSVTAAQLAPGAAGGGLRLDAPLTGADINELTLGQVPEAAHAEEADRAQKAVEAETALTAFDAIDAETVNGHHAGCPTVAQEFAGACWMSSPAGPATAPQAAAACAASGGSLPEALQLAAFAELPGISLDAGDEWSGDLTTFSGPNAYAVVVVSNTSVLNTALSSATKKYRCVLPLLR